MKLDLDERYRPHYHFSPPAAWLNDPNGMVYYAGEYHLFYQHYPDEITWGPMHWGHAVSRDLLHWEHLPIALYPDEVGAIFSGSAVIDWQNRAGFGPAAMVALFTHECNGRQMQSLAYSTDKGRTWSKYAGNPLIEPPAGIPNFRDPKVFWYARAGSGHWVMLLVAGDRVLFYTSPDLRQWELASSFGPSYGATCGVWETPELCELPVDGGPETRWLLSVAVGDCAPAGGSGVQYFVGAFDGVCFTSDNPPATVLWADYGADFYAPQGWNETPDGRPIWLAWLSNWVYAREVPATTFRGTMTIPRELALKTTAAGVRLVQRPIRELAQLRGRHWQWAHEAIAGASDLLAAVSGQALEIIAELAVAQPLPAERLGLRVRNGGGEFTTIGYDVRQQRLFVDRTQSGQVDFNAAFPAVHSADLAPIDGCIRLHIFVDRCSLEVLANDGLVAFTEQIFPDDASVGVELFSAGGSVMLTRLDIYAITP